MPHQFIGLRPGEKLHEALWDEVDEVLPSQHPRILVVRPRGKPLKGMEAVVRELEQLAVDGIVGPLLAKVQEIVPSYPGRVDNGGPWVLNVDAEAQKPEVHLNGQAAASPEAQPLKRRS